MAEGGRTPPRSPGRNRQPDGSPRTPDRSSTRRRSPAPVNLSPTSGIQYMASLYSSNDVDFKDSMTWPDLLQKVRHDWNNAKHNKKVKLGSTDKIAASIDKCEKIWRAGNSTKEERERARRKLRSLSDFIDRIVGLDETASPVAGTGSPDSEEKSKQEYEERQARLNRGPRPLPRMELFSELLNKLHAIRQNWPLPPHTLDYIRSIWDDLILMGVDIPGAFYWETKLERFSNIMNDPNADESKKAAAFSDMIDMADFLAPQIVNQWDRMKNRSPPESPTQERYLDMLRRSYQRPDPDDDGQFREEVENGAAAALNYDVLEDLEVPYNYHHTPYVPFNTPESKGRLRQVEHRASLRSQMARGYPLGLGNEGFRETSPSDPPGIKRTANKDFIIKSGGIPSPGSDVEWEGSNKSSTSPVTDFSPSPARDYHQLYKEGIRCLDCIKNYVSMSPGQITNLEDRLQYAYQTLFETPHRQDTEVTRMMAMVELKRIVKQLQTYAKPSPVRGNFYSPVTPPTPSPNVSPYYGGQVFSSWPEEAVQNASDLLQRAMAGYESSPEQIEDGVPILADNQQDPSYLQSPQPPSPQRSRSPSPTVRRRLF